MPRITDYRFGHLSTDREAFSRDVVLGPEGVYANWWRMEGHKLQWEDIREFVEKQRPEIVVVGQGKFGMMSVSREVKKELAARGIGLIAERTDKAVKKFNELQDKRRVLGAFHLTC